MKIKTIGAAFLAGAMVAGCGNETEKKADEFALSVNGVKLMQSQIDADVEAIVKKQGDKIPADQLERARQMMANQVAQSFIIENVLVAKAKAEGHVVTDADRKAREDEFLKAIAKVPNSPKTLEAYFKEFPLGEARARSEFENGILIDKMIKAKQSKRPAKDYTAEAKKVIDGIVSNNTVAAASEKDVLKKIKALKAELDKTPAAEVTNKFAKLAKENSACPSSAKGGDLGEFTHGQMVKEFDEVAFKLPVGKVSEPVKTQFGYHLILTTKKIPEVAAKGDKPAEPEKVQASHILIKSQAKQDVPKMEEIVKFMQKQDERQFMQTFVMGEIRAAKIEASEKYKQFLPPAEAPKACADPACKDAACDKSAKPVEKPAKK